MWHMVAGASEGLHVGTLACTDGILARRVRGAVLAVTGRRTIRAPVLTVLASTFPECFWVLAGIRAEFFSMTRKLK